MAESEVTSENVLGGSLYTKFPVELSVEQDISSPDKSAADSSDYALNSDAPLEELPNNNISGSLDCLDHCPTSQTAAKLCDYESDSLAAQYGLDKKLIVKLEAPVFGNKLSVSLNKVDSSEESLTLKASDGNSDVSNGVVKKKRKSRQDGSSRSRQRSNSGRGRPPKKRQTTIATYHSQISGDKNTIKIRIRKSHLTGTQVAPPVKKSRQRKKQKKAEITDSEGSEYDEPSKKSRAELASSVIETEDNENSHPLEQSVWGQHLPENFLLQVFQHLCQEQGSLPLLVKLCRICKLWRSVAISPSLWENVDLSSCVYDRSKTDIRLQWLIRNRLMACHDLNLSDWKILNIQIILEELCEKCPELRGLNLSGWSGLTAENLKYLATECSKLERLDLSAINTTNQGTKSALNAAPLVSLAQTMGERLTHLVLAHNKLVGCPQILNAIAAHCPNLQLLDLSNIKTHAYNSSLLPLEKLQEGCPKIRVLRVTNSQILLAPASLTAQVASPGFPDLEELSLAGIEDDHTTSKFIDDNGLERILKTSNRLRLLDVRGCTKITDSGLVRVPAWDLEHLFLSTCYVTRLNHSGLELIIQKWSHSLIEVDLAWSTATKPLDAAVMTLAEKGEESSIRTLDLRGSSVSLESVKAVLEKCPHIQSINLQSCRALPRGIKRLYEGSAVAELRDSFKTKPAGEDMSSAGSSPEQGEGGSTPKVEGEGTPKNDTKTMED